MRGLFVTRNPEARRLARTLSRLAPTDLPLLFEGETGTGKSALAAKVHRAGRSGRPFVVVDCGAVPETLLASELFGHRAGAFTDATRARAGYCERAGDGTLVLDRVDALPLPAQVVLLRVLEERRFVPVGAATFRPLRARVVATCGPGLGARLAAGSFRSDLFHRLAGFHAVLPPLHRRPEDILPAARAALRRAGRGRDTLPNFGRDAEKALLAHPWPGNFRELETVVRRAALLTSAATVHAADLGLPTAAPPIEPDGEEVLTLAAVGRRYALAVLAREAGNVSRAALRLGISRRTLIRWRDER